MAFVDLEMTGLDPSTDRVIEVCIERVVGSETLARLCSLIKPERAEGIDAGVHGITSADLVAAPSFAAVAPQVTELLSGAVLVAHGAKHDIAFLKAEFERLGGAFAAPVYLDTLPIARGCLDVPAYGLSQLARHFSIDNTQAHRAGNDVRVMRRLFAELRRASAAETVKELLPRQRAAVDVAAVVAQAQHALEAGAAARLRYRVRGKPIQELQFCTTAVRADLDPPRVLGYLQHSRGRRELRADRILAFELVEPSGAAPSL